MIMPGDGHVPRRPYVSSPTNARPLPPMRARSQPVQNRPVALLAMQTAMEGNVLPPRDVDACVNMCVSLPANLEDETSAIDGAERVGADTGAVPRTSRATSGADRTGAATGAVPRTGREADRRGPARGVPGSEFEYGEAEERVMRERPAPGEGNLYSASFLGPAGELACPATDGRLPTYIDAVEMRAGVQPLIRRAPRGRGRALEQFQTSVIMSVYGKWLLGAPMNFGPHCFAVVSSRNSWGGKCM